MSRGTKLPFGAGPSTSSTGFKGDITETVTITTAPEGGFVLVDAEGKVIAQGPGAKALSRRAFGLGAQKVVHNYDLKLAEEEL